MPFWDQTKIIARSYPNVGFDIAEVLDHHEYSLSDSEFIALVREFGVERFVFGSDFPWHDRTPVLERVIGVDLTPEEKQKILGENALHIYKITD